MNKKYQIFISSTFEDLEKERNQAIKAILEMGHIPVGMEMFSAADEEQWELIARQIEQTDYYILIVANRYGSETSDGISYTEKEYDYAVKKGVPVLGFVLDDGAPWPTKFSDTDEIKKIKLTKFKSKVKNKLVKFWTSKEDLHGKISISLMKAMTTTPRIGWIRTSETVGVEVTNELSRLSIENAKLRADLGELIKEKENQVDEVKKVVHVMEINKIKFSVRKTIEWSEADLFEVDFLNVFLTIAPVLINENTSINMARHLALRHVGANFFDRWPVGSNVITKLIADYVALELIEPSKKKHSVNDNDEYWTLTKLGKEVLKRARRIQLEEGLNIPPTISVNDESELSEDIESTS
ncbi:TPA: DUF4062 domain-containing protein [Serratia fonticola]